MSALWVVKHFDIIEHVASSRLPCRINLSLNPLSLEELKETFSNLVSMAVTKSGHAAHTVVSFQIALPVSATELAFLIQMHHPVPCSFRRQIADNKATKTNSMVLRGFIDQLRPEEKIG